MKKYIIAFLICLGCFSFSYGQSADEKIAEAINNLKTNATSITEEQRKELDVATATGKYLTVYYA